VSERVARIVTSRLACAVALESFEHAAQVRNGSRLRSPFKQPGTVHEEWVLREFEGLGPMRLRTEGAPELQ